MTDVHGFAEPGFEAVRDAFAANFEQHGEVGAAVCVHHRGEPVVDLWAGVADVKTGRPWQHDTTKLVFSTTKGATAICANLLAQRGELDLDAEVGEYWPEFATAGKEATTVRMLLSHQAGLPVVDADLTLEECLAWDPVVEALAAQEPLWEPGTAHGYHALTYGWLVGEVIRRVDGRSIGRFFAEEVAQPLGLDFWIGLPEEEHPRVALLTGGGITAAAVEKADPEVRKMIEQFLGPDSLTGRALGGPGGVFAQEGVFNRPEVWAAEIPAANGVCTARSLARMYAATIGEVGGIRILDPETVDAARSTQAEGPDRVLFMPVRWGLGFMLSSNFVPLLGKGSFGHAGAGGSLGFADPESDIAFGYVMNRMQTNLAGDPRTVGLIGAIRHSVA